MRISMGNKRTIITKQLWLSKPLYIEGEQLLKSLSPEDRTLIEAALEELPPGDIVVSTSRKSGYRELNISVVQE
jgi:hypothetical protein